VQEKPPVIVGILQVELAIDGAQSLKDKRRVVSSVKARLHRQHQVSVAEVGTLDEHTRATLGIVMAASDVGVCQSMLDRIMDQLRQQRDCYVSDHSKQILTGMTGQV
jgi:uncharacterized protein YlxP (DUF503 family)